MKDQEVSSLNIAVIEDAKLTRETVVTLLEQNGHNVHYQAASASEMMKQLEGDDDENNNQRKRFDIDLFIIDVVMPEVSGVELSKTLSPLFKKASFILTSSLNMENLILDSLANRTVDFLKKPFTAKKLIESVKQVQKLKTSSNQ